MSVSERCRPGEMRSEVRVSSVYERPSAGDGTRILVDPTWPVGVPHNAQYIKEWFPALAPSPRLRRRFDRKPANFAEFRRCYLNELREPLRALALACLRQAVPHGTLSLLTAAEDVQSSHAAVLAEWLRSVGSDAASRLARAG